MKITQRQLRQIIKEELMREMLGMMPPNLGHADTMAVSCGTCVNFCPDTQTCMAFGDYPVSADMVCDAWTPMS